MKVTLIDYTGACSPDPLYAARLLLYTKDTRLEQSAQTRVHFDMLNAEAIEKELAYVANTIRSSWEFVDYTFQITGVSRAFTHQFVRTRTGSYAQQSQRSTSMADFDDVIPPAITADSRRLRVWHMTMNQIRIAYDRLKELGAETQDARGVLPTNISTNIIAKFNLRTLADLVGKRDNPRAQGEYTEVVKGMVASMLEVHPWVKPFLYPERTSTPALDAILAELLEGATPASKPAINDALKEIDRIKSIWG